jgi:hypothetical protein
MTNEGMPNKHSDYIVYVDESGDHGPVSPEFPVFVLAFCIFKKTEYAQQVTTLMHELKFKHFGHDAVVLHEREIRKALPPFSFLQNSARRTEFLSDLATLVDRAPFVLIAAVIDKHALSERYEGSVNPYHLALRFGLERIEAHRTAARDHGLVHVVFESRGRQEDRTLELEFRRVCDNNDLNQPLQMEPLFAHKLANHCGLQLADLVARPIGVNALRPQQPNRAFEALKSKFCPAPDGKTHEWGLKRFP